MGEFDAQKRQDEEEQAARIERRNQAAEVRKQLMRRRKVAVGGLAATAALAFGISSIGSNQKPESHKAKHPTGLPAKIAASLDKQPQYAGLVCESEKRTFRPGQTVYSLSVKGLGSDPSFKNAVYLKNTRYVEQQAKRNRALAIFKQIPSGTKVKILANCINYFPVEPYFNGSSNSPRFDKNGNLIPDGYVRTLTYQDYPGTDNKKHHDVWVDYLVKKDGQPVGVIDCRPAPHCDSFVAEAPKHHNQTS